MSLVYSCGRFVQQSTKECHSIVIISFISRGEGEALGQDYIHIPSGQGGALNNQQATYLTLLTVEHCSPWFAPRRRCCSRRRRSCGPSTSAPAGMFWFSTQLWVEDFDTYIYNNISKKSYNLQGVPSTQAPWLGWLWFRCLAIVPSYTSHFCQIPISRFGIGLEVLHWKFCRTLNRLRQ